MDLDLLLYSVPGFAIWGIYFLFFRPPTHEVSLEDEDIGELEDLPQFRAEKEQALYYADRKDPVKAWFHGVFALQYGLKTDPLYWSAREASEHMTEAWGFDDPETALRSLEWYLEEPVNPAYDMVRTIIVARSCVAAGWLHPAKGALLCDMAQRRILGLVTSWEELANEIRAGRLVVFKGKLPRGRKKRDQANLEFGRKQVFGRVAFQVQMPPDEFESMGANEW